MIQPKTWMTTSYHLLIWPLVWNAAQFHFAARCLQSLPHSPPLCSKDKASSHPLQGTYSESSKRPQNKLCPRLPQYCSLSRFHKATFNTQNSEETYPSIPELAEKHYPLSLTLSLKTLHILQALLGCLMDEKPRLNRLPLCKSEHADISQLQRVTPPLKVKAAVYPLRGFIYCLISNSS